MQRFGIKGLLVAIGVFFITIIMVARLVESSSLEKTARESFDLSELIDGCSISIPWVSKNAPVIVAHVNERDWGLARSRLLEHFGSATAIDGIDDPVRKAIVDKVGEVNFANVLVFVESDPIDGVVYCVIGRSKKDDPILFFVVQRI